MFSLHKPVLFLVDSGEYTLTLSNNGSPLSQLPLYSGAEVKIHGSGLVQHIFLCKVFLSIVTYMILLCLLLYSCSWTTEVPVVSIALAIVSTVYLLHMLWSILDMQMTDANGVQYNLAQGIVLVGDFPIRLVE